MQMHGFLFFRLALCWQTLSCCISIFLLCSSLSAQNTPQVRYSFDLMDLSESTGNFDSGEVRSSVSYECGVGNTPFALTMDGSPDTVILDPNVKDLFIDDFSLGFYFWADESTESYTLFSIQENCLRDSSLNIRFNRLAGTDIREITLEYAANAGEVVRFNHQLSDENCWNQLVFTKENETFSLYINGDFIQSIRFVDQIRLGRNFPVYVGFSDCVGQFDDFFSGRIDEIEIYDFALDETALQNAFLNPDKILTVDTTIFEGDAFRLRVGPTCTNDVQWTPSVGLDDATIVRPIAGPISTTTYELTFDHGSCIATDSVRISVLLEENIDCDLLLLPSAFTPNGDELNDGYGISNDFIIEDFSRFEIFDRWGLKLFDALDKSETWDGTYNGQTMMPGTYIYKIEYSCMESNFQKTGSFNLLR